MLQAMLVAAWIIQRTASLAEDSTASKRILGLSQNKPTLKQK
jgi:hypothetical protein